MNTEKHNQTIEETLREFRALYRVGEDRVVMDEVAMKYGYERGFRDGATATEPKHIFWGAGEPDCPMEIKAPNGELTELRCKNCDRPKDRICLGILSLNQSPDQGNSRETTT